MQISFPSLPNQNRRHGELNDLAAMEAKLKQELEQNKHHHHSHKSGLAEHLHAEDEKRFRRGKAALEADR